MSKRKKKREEKRKEKRICPDVRDKLAFSFDNRSDTRGKDIKRGKKKEKREKGRREGGGAFNSHFSRLRLSAVEERGGKKRKGGGKGKNKPEATHKPRSLHLNQSLTLEERGTRKREGKEEREGRGKRGTKARLQNGRLLYFPHFLGCYRSRGGKKKGGRGSASFAPSVRS